MAVGTGVVRYISMMGVNRPIASANATMIASLAAIVILALFVVFISSIKEILGVWFNNGPKTASLIPLGTILFTPIFGGFVDRKGKAASLMMLGSALLILAHLSLSLSDSVYLAYTGLLLLGIAFSLVPAAMWPSMVKLVPEKQIGTAYGLMYSIQNLGLWGFPLIAGLILDKTNPGNPEVADYGATILMFSILGLLGVFFALMLKREDKRSGMGIELPLNKKQ